MSAVWMWRHGLVRVKVGHRQPPTGWAGPRWRWEARVSLDETPIPCAQCRAEDRAEFIEGGGAADSRAAAKAAALAWVRGVAQVLADAADKLEGEA